MSGSIPCSRARTCMAMARSASVICACSRAAVCCASVALWRDVDEWTVCQDAHEQIISAELFAAAQARLERKKKLYSRPRGGSREHLLSGMVRCATGHPSLSAYALIVKGHTYYRCTYRSSYGKVAAEAISRPRLNLQRPRGRTATRDRAFLRRAAVRPDEARPTARAVGPTGSQPPTPIPFAWSSLWSDFAVRSHVPRACVYEVSV